MIIFKIAADVNKYLKQKQKEGALIGFAPTMGALHGGHTSLIKKAKDEGQLTVCSIFINPTQFNDKEDYKKYPITTDADVALLIKAGCDVLFLPDEKQIYPKGYNTQADYDFGYLNSVLEGALRPGHFNGVAEVVGRLLDIVNPDYLYMGQKDYQQCMIIKKLLELTGKEKNIHLFFCPIIREWDGLAKSSRNRRLTEPQRNVAGVIYQCLVSIQEKKGKMPFSTVQKECINLLTKKGFEAEYVALAKAETLELLEDYYAEEMVALIAARLGAVRLIDNILV